MVEMAIFYVQRAVTPELGNPKLGMSSHGALHLMVVYICAKFRKKIFDRFEVTEQTQFS